jgi:DNA-binding winged helix-turn-helix (wHTH) protein
MSHSKNTFPIKRKYLIVLLLLLFTSVIGMAFSKDDTDDFKVSKREVLLRRIGHELLLQSGDRTSRVLPVKKITENEYQISFANDLIFQPDSLINTTRRVLAHDPFAADYIVNVLRCDDSGVAYGYAISKNKKEDIVACIGRTQPKACYRISIKFKPAEIHAINNGYLLGSLPFLAFVGFMLLRPAKKQQVVPEVFPADTYMLGSMLFDSKNRKLRVNEQTIDLTATETRILLIFALSPNLTIERSRLQKEIWEDEGVIVGRSLDMFISKLRKKLEPDPDINIVAIRGKGYKLEINSQEVLPRIN